MAAVYESLTSLCWVEHDGESEDPFVSKMSVGTFEALKRMGYNVKRIGYFPCLECLHWNGLRWGCELGDAASACISSWEDAKFTKEAK